MRDPARPDRLQAYGFRYYFTLLLGVLFTFPSRYLFTIGHQRVFSLGGWFLQIPTDFHLFRGTWDHLRESQHAFAYRTFTFCGSLFQAIQLTHWFLTPRHIRNSDSKCPATPLTQRLRPFLCQKVWAVPRSLVTTDGIVGLLFLPRGTEIFHFPPLAHSRL